MIKFKMFILNEELLPDQKARVSEWPRDGEALRHTDHFFGKNNDVVIKQLPETVDKSEIHKAVERHLNTEIPIHHYKAGLTTDRYNREVRIGRVIKDDNLRNQYANDSTRQGIKFNGLVCHISRHPHDVAGQTSGSQSWAQMSCKNFETGNQRKYLKGEVKHGTVVSYLKDHNGKEIARATFQPFINKKGMRMYRYNASYGINHAAFERVNKQVEKELSDNHEYDRDDPFYTIHPEVHDDLDDPIIHHPNFENQSKEEFDKFFRKTMSDKSTPTKIRELLMTHPHITAEHIDIGLKDKNKQVQIAALRHENATPEQLLRKGLNAKDSDVRAKALSNPNVPIEYLLHTIEGRNEMMSGPWIAALSHPKIDGKFIQSVLNRKGEEHDRLKLGLIAHNPSITADHITQALSGNSNFKFLKQAAVEHPKATTNHITKALNDDEPYVRASAIRNRNATREHIERALNDRSGVVRGGITQNPNTTSDDITHLLDRELNDPAPFTGRHSHENALDLFTVNNIINHPNVTKKHLQKMIDSGKFNNITEVLDNIKSRLKRL